MQSLTGTVKHYDWGSVTALPKLLQQSGDGQPWAEYWLGTHEAGCALVDDVPLDNWLATHDGALSGPETEAFGAHLPYLLKLLAASQPLSLQAHPSRPDAQRGFADEEARGLALDDPTRSFKDDWPKPELLVALAPFEALSGFRDPSETLSLFDALGVDDDIMRPTFGPLRYRHGAAALAEVFLDCLTLDDTRRTILTEVLAAAVRHGQDEGELGDFARLAITLDEYYPDDPSLLAALLLNHVTLKPGQGLHNAAGVVHSYLQGVGIEIMASSDNVLRAGLTSKHVDHAALVSIVNFDPAPPQICDPEPDGPEVWRYPAPDPEFALWRLNPTEDDGARPLPEPGRARIVLVTDGYINISSGEGTTELVQGQAGFVQADEQATFTGDATAYMAGPGVSSGQFRQIG